MKNLYLVEGVSFYLVKGVGFYLVKGFIHYPGEIVSGVYRRRKTTDFTDFTDLFENKFRNILVFLLVSQELRCRSADVVVP